MCFVGYKYNRMEITRRKLINLYLSGPAHAHKPFKLMTNLEATKQTFCAIRYIFQCIERAYGLDLLSRHASRSIWQVFWTFRCVYFFLVQGFPNERLGLLSTTPKSYYHQFTSFQNNRNIIYKLLYSTGGNGRVVGTMSQQYKYLVVMLGRTP